MDEVVSPTTGGGNAGPSITAPIYATPPRRGAGGGGSSTGVPFNERFKPSSEPLTMESMYSLAHSVETEVQRQLSGEQEVAAGTPLAEALVYKGISTRSASVSSASGGEGNNTSYGSDYPSIRHEPASDVQNLYSPVPKKSSSGGGAVRPVPKPRAATTLRPFLPRTVDSLDPPSQHHQLSASLSDASAVSVSPIAAARGTRAETLANGYMQPRQLVKKVGNYDQLPLGPPRPAVGPTPGSHSPKQHRSALLRADQGAPSQEMPPSPVEKQNSTYINVNRNMADNFPPTVDRKSKPLMPSPPRVDRNLKPKGGSEGTLTASDSSGTDSPARLTESPPLYPPTEIPPVFPTRTTSLMNPLSENRPPQGNQSGEGTPPEFPLRITSLANNLEASGSYREEEFSERDLPKPTTRTMQYTQVEFDDTGRPAIAELGQTLPPDVSRAPVPAPRGGFGRVNYSDVDLTATRGLSREMTLGEAERQVLKDKPYINVRKDGDVDEDSDPGYYTHMRVSHSYRVLQVGRMQNKPL